MMLWLPDNRLSLVQWQLVMLIGLALVRGLIYLSLFPPWVAPDEPAHFEVIRALGQKQQMPTLSYYQSTPVNPELSDSFQTFRMWELLERPTPAPAWLNDPQHSIIFVNYPYPGGWISAETRPLLPHLLLAPVSALFSAYDIATELYILRVVSVLLGVGVTIIAWLIVKNLFPQQPQFWVAIPAFIIFLPMHTHIFASLNTDTFAGLVFSSLLLVFVLTFKQGVSFVKLLLIIILLGVSFFTKRTLLFTAVWVAIAAILYIGYRRRWVLKDMALAGLILTTLLVIGVILALASLEQPLVNLWITAIDPATLAEQSPLARFLQSQLSLAEIAEIYAKSGLFALITFWGDFGGANINIPWAWAYSLLGVCLVIMFGAALFFVKTVKTPGILSQYQRYILMIFVAGIVLSLFNAFGPVFVIGPKWGPPARYFFPVIIPIATFLYLGTWQLFPAAYRQQYLLPVWLVALIGYDALVVTTVLIPFLYG